MTWLRFLEDMPAAENAEIVVPRAFVKGETTDELTEATIEFLVEKNAAERLEERWECMICKKRYPDKPAECKCGTSTFYRIEEVPFLENRRRFGSSVPFSPDGLKKMIEKVSVLRGQPTIYVFEMHGRKISLKDEQLLSPLAFRVAFLSQFNKILPPFKTQEWTAFVNELLEDDKKTEYHDYEDLNQNKILEEELIFEIENSIVVDSLEKTERGRVFYDEKRDEILVPSKTISGLVARSNTKLEVSAVRGILQPYLVGNSIARKIGKKPSRETRRFWRFKAGKLQIDVSKKFTLEDENTGGGADENDKDNQRVGDGKDAVAGGNA